MDSCFQGDEHHIDSNGSVAHYPLPCLLECDNHCSCLRFRPRHDWAEMVIKADAPRRVTRVHVTTLRTISCRAQFQAAAYVLRLLYSSKKNFHFEYMFAPALGSSPRPERYRPRLTAHIVFCKTRGFLELRRHCIGTNAIKRV